MADRACKLLNARWDKESSPVGKQVDETNSDWVEVFGQAVGIAWAGFNHEGGGSPEIVQVKSMITRPKVARELAEAARLAGELLAGRSLLKEEATQLLASVSSIATADPLAVLQQASLAGALQLAAAVAPLPAAPPQSGFRGWASRLRLARLYGPGGKPSRPEELICGRCGSGRDKLRRTPCAACGQACAYCEACLAMGRSRECELLVIGVPRQGAEQSRLSVASRNAGHSRSFFSAPQGSVQSYLPVVLSNASQSPSSLSAPQLADPSRLSEPSRNAALSPDSFSAHNNARSAQNVSLPTSNETTPNLTDRWGLSPAQSDAAAKALAYLNAPYETRIGHSFLLWAVTGAGKTEMIFPLLEAVLARGGRALVATPRRDVVLELAPRLAKAFPHYERVVLYGGSADRWENGALTLATTHQLMRFQEAFDLVLIDELDAFPYHNDAMLHYAADKCRKKRGTTVLLSATPPLPLQRAAAKGRLPNARVPVRYHRHPLPVPQRVTLASVTDMLRKQNLPPKLVKPLQHSIQRGAQIFLFVPYVKQVEPIVQLLRRYAQQLRISPLAISGTSSKDEVRTEKVVSFREHAIQLLVTTTILERGVTIPKSDVYILDAHNRLFDAASLVQMAGRAGRSAADPYGGVFFGAPEWTSSQRGAIRQINEMNGLAKRRGYFTPSLEPDPVR
ncbi:DEAD/DEAH box helicase [Cohnella herbarum]|uniref:DEAD/DEAH box helicase n=2 Tax=Cohnella herbarum TaxID=2728023 RepID=A0A7Z2ZRN1_9BACL|nr:DEAD/DEAH box helicase [Cohnella herbarum]